jgi:deoxyribose-phosphate aldolase
MSQYDTKAIARTIDHTLLKPEATDNDVAALCAEAISLGVFSVCVSPPFVALAKSKLTGSQVKVATVCGFPSGKHASAVKAAEAALSVSHGADEVDMVIDVGQAVMGHWANVESDIAAVRAAVPRPQILKVILETAALNDTQIVEACRCAERAGADFVKTSTGFHPTGGASLVAIILMAQTVGGRLGIKASGGIRTAAFATELLEAGATRLGLSASRAVLDGVTSAHAAAPAGY